MVNSVSGNYNNWIADLNSRGIKTTHLGNGEANFANYTAALSDDLKQEIVASFDCEADYDLQAKLAGLYGSKSVMQSGDIVSAAKANGIQVNVQYVKTSYIVDNKADGHYDTDVTNGAIAVYTFKDGNGGEIKIADANGNGALETEELFMNELLSGVVSDISASSGGGNTAAGNVQNNMVNQIDTLLAQLQTQLEEQQKRFDEITATLQLQDTNIKDNKKADKKEDKKPEIIEETDIEENNTDEIKKEAMSIIKNEYPELTQTQMGEYLEDIIDKVIQTGISVEKAVEAIIGNLETV